MNDVFYPPLGTGGLVVKPGTPTGIEGLVAWYSAYNSSKSQDSAGKIPAEIGDPVGALNDLSGNERHLIQATGANKPIYTADQFGRLPGLVFTTSDILMWSGSITLAGNISLVMYAKSTHTGVWNPYIALKEAATGYQIHLSSIATTDYGRALIGTSANSNQSANGPAINIKDGTPHLAIATYDRSAGKLNVYIDGVVGTEKTITGGLPTVFDQIQLVTNNTLYDIGDAVIYSELLSPLQILMLQEHFAGQ